MDLFPNDEDRHIGSPLVSFGCVPVVHVLVLCDVVYVLSVFVLCLVSNADCIV